MPAKTKKQNSSTTQGKQEDSPGFDPTALVEANASENKSEATDPLQGKDAEATDKKAPEVEPDETQQVVSIFDIPVHSCHPGYATSLLNCRLTRRQSAAAKVLWSSLSRDGQRFQGGRSSNAEGTTVEGVNDGVRWLLDRVAEKIEDDHGVDLLADFDLVF